MARKKSKQKSSSPLIIVVIILVVVICAYFYENISNVIFDETINLDGKLAVHFIDVGQGDAILIQTPENEFMLIDTGESTQHIKLTGYLDKFKVKEFKYVVFTHPHSDHIGSADKIVRDYKIETLIMPYATNTSQTFNRLVTEIENKNMEITPPVPGETFKFGGAEITILAPFSEEYKNLNNYSVVLKINYGNHSFLFGGDMEKESENEVIEYFGSSDLKADVLKVAHHGSTTSSQQKFLEIVAPQLAVIFVGKDNTYNHPNAQIVDRLASIGATVLRTDREGDIVVVSDGAVLSVKQ